MNIETKAHRLLTEGRVHLADVTGGVVDGDGARYTVTWDGAAWVCTCVGYAHRHRCAHATAVALVTRPPGDR
jgi:hypothetical protein